MPTSCVALRCPRAWGPTAMKPSTPSSPAARKRSSSSNSRSIRPCWQRPKSRAPALMHVVLGDRTERAFRYADYARYFSALSARFVERVQGAPIDTYPDPCEHCDLCRWRELCTQRRIDDDHLCQVAGITRLQIKKLQSAGVTTLEALATFPGTRKSRRWCPRPSASCAIRRRSSSGPVRPDVATSTSCHPMKRVCADLRGCPNPIPAISSSTWKATHWKKAGSSTCSALLLRRRQARLQALLGTPPRRREARL